MPVLRWDRTYGKQPPEEKRLWHTPCHGHLHRCPPCRRYVRKRISLELPGGTTLGCSLCCPLSSSSSPSQLPSLKTSTLSLSPVELNDISKTQNHSPEPPGSIGCRWESPQPASDLRSLWETPRVSRSKVISLVDTIFGIRRKIEEDYFLTIFCFPDVVCVDNQAALTTLSSGNPAGTEFTQHTLELLSTLQHAGWKIQGLWTPAHCEIPGNEQADKLAMLGSRKTNICSHARVTKTWL